MFWLTFESEKEEITAGTRVLAWRLQLDPMEEARVEVMFRVLMICRKGGCEGGRKLNVEGAGNLQEGGRGAQDDYLTRFLFESESLALRAPGRSPR